MTPTDTDPAGQPASQPPAEHGGAGDATATATAETATRTGHGHAGAGPSTAGRGTRRQRRRPRRARAQAAGASGPRRSGRRETKAGAPRDAGDAGRARPGTGRRRGRHGHRHARAQAPPPRPLPEHGPAQADDGGDAGTDGHARRSWPVAVGLGPRRRLGGAWPTADVAGARGRWTRRQTKTARGPAAGGRDGRRRQTSEGVKM